MMVKKAAKKPRTVARVKKKKKRKKPESLFPNGLNFKTMKFIEGIRIGLTETEAARRAKMGSPHVTGSRLMKRANVSAELVRQQEEVRERSIRSGGCLDDSLYARAFVTIADLLRDDGSLRPSSEWSWAEASRVKSITYDKDGVPKKIEMFPMLPSLELRGRLRGDLPGDNQGGRQLDEFRRVSEEVFNGNRDAVTGVPANGV